MAPPLVISSVGLVLESIFYGVYCVIFGLYLRIQLKRADRWKGVLLYALTVTLILCTAYFTADIVHLQFLIMDEDVSLWLSVAIDALYVAIDFISQLILLYRCWIMWRQPLVLVVPGILSLAFLVTALTTLGFVIKFIVEDIDVPDWYYGAVVAFFSISLAVNALVTGLIVYKIVSVYRSSREFGITHANVNGPRDLSPLISILIESGMITFAAQFVQSVMYKADPADFPIISGLVVMLYGISPTLVLVRVEMGVSYDRHTSRPVNSPRGIHWSPFASNNTQPTIDVVGGDTMDSHSRSEMIKLMRKV